MRSSKLSQSEYDRLYHADIFMSSVFSAFFSALQYRKKHDGLTQSELSARMGKDKTQISKLFSGPANWELRKASDTALAMGLEIQFSLRDKSNPSVVFTPHGQVFSPARGVKTGMHVIPAMATRAIEAQTSSNQIGFASHQTTLKSSAGMRTIVRQPIVSKAGSQQTQNIGGQTNISEVEI